MYFLRRVCHVTRDFTRSRLVPRAAARVPPRGHITVVGKVCDGDLLICLWLVCLSFIFSVENEEDKSKDLLSRLVQRRSTFAEGRSLYREHRHVQRRRGINRCTWSGI